MIIKSIFDTITCIVVSGIEKCISITVIPSMMGMSKRMKSEIKKNLVNDSLTNLEEALTSKIKFKGFHYLICFL